MIKINIIRFPLLIYLDRFVIASNLEIKPVTVVILHPMDFVDIVYYLLSDRIPDIPCRLGPGQDFLTR